MTGSKRKVSLKKKLLAIVLAVVMAFGFLIPTTLKAETADAAAPSSYSTITASSSVSVSSVSSSCPRYFKFVPTQSGTYKFYSSNRSGDPYGALLDANGNTIETDDDDGDGNNFSITHDCTANTAYYIKAYAYSSGSASYRVNVETVSLNNTPNTPTPSGVVEITAAGGANYSLFNSGATGEGRNYSSSSNYDEDSYTNGGYDLYAEDGTSVDTIRLGLGFKVLTNTIENINLNIYSYDVDEIGSSSCNERDYIYLVDETASNTVKLSGYLSGQNNTWNTSNFTIPANLLEYGHTYHLSLEVTCTNGCTHFWVYTRTVNLVVNGTSGPIVTPQTGIENADLSASISSSGLVSATLTANAYTQESYTIEYKAVCASNIAQYGGKEYSVTIPTTSTPFSTTFQLEAGAPRGTYEITAFIKDANRNVVATRTATASYGYSAVSYNANGGSQNLPTDGTTYSSGDTVTVKFDYIPSMYGYTFLGWSTDRNATTPTYTENGTKTFTIGSSDVTLYAVWEETAVPPVEPPVNPSVDQWDGTTDTTWYTSSQTEFTIYTAEQLAGFARLVNSGNTFSGKTVYLGNNIDLAGIEWTPIGVEQNIDGTSEEQDSFGGTFDGNYFVISNVKISNLQYYVGGLFGSLENATVKNVGVENVDYTITRYARVGGLCGIMHRSTVDNCYAVGTLELSDFSYSKGSMGIGGLIGDMQYNNTLTNSYANCVLDNKNSWRDADYGVFVGGLVGLVCGSGDQLIDGCYTNSTIVTNGVSTATIGGFVGKFYTGNLKIDNCFSMATIDSEYVKMLIGKKDDHADRLSIVNSYYYERGTHAYGGSKTTIENLQSQNWIESTLGWDFDDVWEFRTGNDYPVLKGFDGNGGTIVPPAHTHTEGAWIVDEAATCVSTGSRHTECTICGELMRTEVIPSGGHDYQLTNTVEPTCTQDGYMQFTCSHCNSTKTQVLYAEGHSFGYDNVCDNCGYEVEIHEHVYEETVVEPTCMDMGYTQYTCTCGYSYRGNYVDQRGHRWNDGEITQQKTCTADGLTTYTCTECNAEYSVVIPAGHNWVEEIAVEATCTTDGLLIRTCLGCGEEEEEVIPAAHTWNEGTVLTEPTCTEVGYKECTCIVCGTVETLEIPVLGHHFVNGICTRCGAGIPDVVTPDTNHPEYGMYFEIDDIISNYGPDYINEYGVLLDYNEGANLKKVAVYLTQDGTMWRRCIACVGENITYATYVPYLSYGEEIKYTGLNSDWINIFRLQENAQGIWCYSDYTTIGVNLEDKDGNLLLSLYDIGQSGAKTRIFTDLEEMIAWLSSESDCINHVAGEWQTIEPTCGAEGLHYTECTVCGERMEETIPATGLHTPSDWIIDSYPSVFTPGQKHKECLVCGQVLETESIPVCAMIKVEDVTVSAGSTVTVTVEVQNAPAILGAVLTFSYDPALTLVSAQAGNAWGSLHLTMPAEYGNPCNFVWDGMNVADRGDGIILTLTFAVPEGAEIGSVYEISASYTDGNIIDENLENVDIMIADGSITIESLMGDVNSDGVVDVADVITLRRYLAGGYNVTINEVQADMDADGEITIADIIQLRRYIVNR